MRKIKHNQYIFILLILFFITACHQPTPQEKLESAIKENPALLQQLEKDMQELQSKTQLRPISAEKLPPSLKEITEEGMDARFYEIDLDLDNVSEWVTIKQRKERSSLLIFKLETTDSVSSQYTDFLASFPSDSTSLSAFPGLIKWSSKERLGDSIVQRTLHFRYEKARKSFVATYYKKEVQTPPFSLTRLTCNFITGNTRYETKKWDDGKLIQQNSTSSSIEFRLPELGSISDKFLRKLD